MIDLDVIEGRGWNGALHPRDKLGRFASKMGGGGLAASGRRIGAAASRIGGVFVRGGKNLARNTVKAAGETRYRRALVTKVDPKTGAVSVARQTIHDRSLVRRGFRTGIKVLRTPEGRVAGGALAAGAALAAGREMLPGARKQRNQARLVKYHRNSRIEWQKNQRVLARSGEEISPGQGVRIGHLRRKGVYLGAEWRPQGRINTTTGRLVIQGKTGTKVVPFRAIKSGRKGQVMSPAEAMARASEHSLKKRTWQRRPPSGAQAMRIALARKNEKRVKFELRNEIRNLRRSGTLPERVAARFGERVAAQYFSKTMRRQRKRHKRPNARANNALRAGRA